MKVEDQKRLQQSNSEIKALTIESLEEHDSKSTTGPCQLRQFGCAVCHHSWWHNVLKSQPVSRCRGGRCGNQRYDALPRNMEFGIGRFICPNDRCCRTFFGFCEATDQLQCRKCGSYSKPYIHPKWKQQQMSHLNPRAKVFYPRFHSQQQQKQQPLKQKQKHQFDSMSIASSCRSSALSSDPSESDVSSLAQLSLNTSPTNTDDSDSEDSEALSQSSSFPFYQPSISSFSASECNTRSQCSSSTSPQGSTPYKGRRIRQPMINQHGRPRVFNASNIHEPTGGTLSTFLTQVNFEMTGEEVILDYWGEENEDKVGACKFECVNCENEYTVICRMVETAECYNCHEYNRPLNWAPPRDHVIQGETDNKHSCSRCDGKGNCPNFNPV